MATPDTYKAFRRLSGKLPKKLEFSTEALPKTLGPSEVLLKIHAVSLNFRDVAMLHDRYPVEVIDRGIAASDCAAEVVAVGSAVAGFSIGARVSPIFNLANITGEEDDASQALGGEVDGVLREYAVFDQKYLVHLPKHLTWEEASTIPCAGVTAWVALNSSSSGPKGRSALLQGQVRSGPTRTGGVSMFALLLCIAAGMTPIITSSSEDKLESIRKLSKTALGINYKKTLDQAGEVMRLTDGKGVDTIVNNVGIRSIPAEIASLRQRGGIISMVGFLEGFEADWHPSALLALMRKSGKIQGISVGSKRNLEDLNRFLDEKAVVLSPLIDQVFPFELSNEAFGYLYSGQHVGKVIIKVSS